MDRVLDILAAWPPGHQLGLVLGALGIVAVFAWFTVDSCAVTLKVILRGWKPGPVVQAKIDPDYDLPDCNHAANPSPYCWKRGGCASQGQCEALIDLLTPDKREG